MQKKVDKEYVLRLLLEINALLERENRTFNMLAFGGTALSFYGIKGFSKDIDLLIENVREEDIGLIRKIKSLAKERGLKLDLELGQQIVWWNLLDDYWELAEEEKIRGLSNINLRKLSVYDIIISKCARYSEGDREDVVKILENRQIDIEFLKSRFEMMKGAYLGYPTQRKITEENFNQVLRLVEEYPR